MWKLREFSHTFLAKIPWKGTVILKNKLFTNKLIWRNISSVRENFSFLHIMEYNHAEKYYKTRSRFFSSNQCFTIDRVKKTQCGNFEILLSPFCHKIFVKAIFSLKNFALDWFDGKYFAWQWIPRFSTLWKIPKRCFHEFLDLTNFFGWQKMLHFPTALFF